MSTSPWDKFFKEKITKIFTESNNVVDIGGGLRIAKDKNNRYLSKNEWILPLMQNVDYKVLDQVPDYNPDIVGDIHDLPFADKTLDAITCIAVLEHVKNPFKAVSEMHRVLKPGGLCLIYVPFIYNYHPMKGYYNDYWRFTEDGIQELCSMFQSIEYINVRGRFETLIHSSPLGPLRKTCCYIGSYIDKITNCDITKQTAGFFIFAIS